MKWCILLGLIAFVSCFPEDDKIVAPGMIGENLYSGYLKTAKQGRTLHYVLAEARQKSSQAPLVVWFNGGPGCSSLLGFIEELGPYLIGNDYSLGDQLTKNEYSWNNFANILFLESPGLVGFSSDTDMSFNYTDPQTADDAFAAIRDFLTQKAPDLKSNQLYISGESYAGKYVPDVVVRILDHNRRGEDYLNLKGLLVGNGVMNFQNWSLDKSTIEYLGAHDFLDMRLWQIYQTSCQRDFESPRCKMFRDELDRVDETNVNPYYVHEVCKDVQSSEAVKLLLEMKQMKAEEDLLSSPSLKDIVECPNDNGAIKYFNLNKHAFNVESVNKTWAPCVDLNYQMSLQGSMQQYKDIFLNKAVRVWLYSGDWDSVVPFIDTLKNIKALGRQQSGDWTPWYYGDDKHHAGFYQEYDSLTFVTVKGAGHMVPQTQPKYAYQMFYNFLKNKSPSEPIP